MNFVFVSSLFLIYFTLFTPSYGDFFDDLMSPESSTKGSEATSASESTTATKPPGKYIDFKTGIQWKEPMDWWYIYTNPQGQYMINAWNFVEGVGPIALKFKPEKDDGCTARHDDDNEEKERKRRQGYDDDEGGNDDYGDDDDEEEEEEEEEESTTGNPLTKSTRKANGTSTQRSTSGESSTRNGRMEPEINTRYMDIVVRLGAKATCERGFIICYVSRLEGKKASAPRIFELKNKNNMKRQCDGMEWPNYERDELVVHAMAFQTTEKGGLSIKTSYSNKEHNVPGNKSEERTFYIHLNEASGLGGSVSYPSGRGFKKSDKSNNFTQLVHNGMLLQDQDPVYSLPFDMLTDKTRPIIINAKGNPECKKINITFEGRNILPCNGKTCQTELSCTHKLVRVKPATFSDYRMETIGLKGNTTTEVKGYPSGEHPVRIGFLYRREPNQQEISFITNAVNELFLKYKEAPWKDYVLKLLANSTAKIEYGYWEVKTANGRKDVVADLFTCTQIFESISFIAHARDLQDHEIYPDETLDFSKDFENVEKCCLNFLRHDITINKIPEISVKNLTMHKQWFPRNASFFEKEVEIGMFELPVTSDENIRDMLAAKYQFSLFGENRRSYYMDPTAPNPNTTFLGGHLFANLSYAESINTDDNYPNYPKPHNIVANFRFPPLHEIKNWTEKVNIKIEQYMFDCDDCRGAGEKRSGLKILVPSLIAYVVSKNGTELLDNFNLIRDYSVDGGKGFLVEYGKGMITTTEAPTTTENGTMTSNGGEEENDEVTKESNGGKSDVGGERKKQSSEGEDEEIEHKLEQKIYGVGGTNLEHGKKQYGGGDEAKKLEKNGDA